VVGGFSFYQRAEIKDILAYLKALLSPQDTLSLLRIINTPARGIGKSTVEQIEQYALANGVSLWTAMERMLAERAFGARAEAAIDAFHRMIQELAADIEKGKPAETIQAVLERTGYKKMLEAEDTEDSRSRLANLEELLNAAADAAERGETLRDFLDHAALISDADSVDERAEVSLLTMHNAKGLEFPIVFIAGMEEGLFPHSRSLQGDGSIEEERRLCYVGMTRAQKKLHLSWARYRRRFGGGQPEQSIPSRFLKEAPASLIERVRGDRGHVDLFAERHMVRESARRNVYTGKTYNSVEAIQQFFGKTPPVSPPAASAAAKPALAPAKAAPATRAKKVGPGSTVEHAKYGRGTVMRLEGTGEDAKLTVSFPGYGLKKLIAKYAGIKVE
jgi:ATP-dependent DNA helicase UvrD/PcrA